MPTTYLLTGCANGIGRHMARVFYNQGHHVVATDIDVVGLATLTADWDQTRVLTLPLDVRSTASWQAVIDQTLTRFGRVDVGLNIAGVVHVGYAAEFNPADVDLVVDVNLKGVILGTRLMAAQMVKQGGGQIINIASLAGVAPIQGLSLYSATKFAVRGFSLAAAGELRKQGVQVSVVCPDLVDTNMLTAQIDHPEAALSFSGGRILTVQDVERAIVRDAIQHRKLEVLIPTSRGWLGKVGNLFPALSFSITDLLRKKGLKEQAVWQATRKNTAGNITLNK
ncbi:SDR family NAD(P)-dependent oxidoreductase [Fibrella sp. HMF5335]|uniref:SDR family NAD(P)-dependent oxidoreductase n=1 Tax=Fibrella rubiginis TaxID=2817060 RepID=A0A939GG75_9BACT|nr:SDR family NAD(P)-dependent oxidoreductase [Fibrella rubiginis]MBO0937756.1 SDR family NAD(P)-dependent oxidoreductase [Fibrella rubiginis]